MTQAFQQQTIRTNETIKEMLDQYASSRSCKVTVHPQTAWYNGDIRQAKRKRKSLERQMRRTHLVIHIHIHSDQCSKPTDNRGKIKTFYISCKPVHNTKVSGPSGKYAPLQEESQHPSVTLNSKDLARFSHFFYLKISNIRSSLEDEADVAV